MKRFFHKVGQILLCILPILSTLGIQLAVTVPITIYYFTALGATGNIPDSSDDIANWIMHNLLNSDYTIYVSAAWGLVSLFVFFIWYKKIHDKSTDIPTKKTLSKFSVSGLLLLVTGLQISIQYLYGLLESEFPQLFTTYNEMMDISSGYNLTGVLIMLVYGIIIAPIHEEYLSRGVVLHYAKKAMPFWFANTLQAALFGLLHMNLIQGTYAFIVGIVLGYIYEKSKNIRVPILFHMLFNVFGIMIPLMPLNTASSSAFLFAGVLGAVVAIAGVVLFNTSLQMRES